MVSDELVKTFRPLAQQIVRPEDAQRNRRVDAAIGNDGRLRQQSGGAFSNEWNGNRPLMLGPYHLWIDASGQLRVKSSKASGDTDGTIVGLQGTV